MNGNFTDGSAGWTVLSDGGSAPGAFVFTTCGVPPRPCLFDETGFGSAHAGSNVLVSRAHTVSPGETLSVTMVVALGVGFTIGSPNSMSFYPNPPCQLRSQARIDVYDAGDPDFPSAASLQGSVFDTTDIAAVPFLGSLIGDAGFSTVDTRSGFTTVPFSLATYVGRTVYFAYRSSSNDLRVAYQILLSDFAISC